jgi:hypothetical protein
MPNCLRGRVLAFASRRAASQAWDALDRLRVYFQRAGLLRS